MHGVVPRPGVGRLLFGLDVRAETLEEAVAAVEEAIRNRRPTRHLALNAAKVSKMTRDPRFLEMFSHFEMIHADGASIVWASRLLGHPLPQRVAGIDLMQRLVERSAELGWRPFFLGAKANVLAECVRRLKERHPTLEIAGSRDGYWREGDPTEEMAVVDEVRSSRADLLFVAVPTPRKERFLLAHGNALGVPFMMGVGGSFDVIAGHVKRAPLAWQKCGFEWAYRLLQEPRKMWKRYLVTNTHFLLIVTKAVLSSRATRQEIDVEGRH